MPNLADLIQRCKQTEAEKQRKTNVMSPLLEALRKRSTTLWITFMSEVGTDLSVQVLYEGQIKKVYLYGVIEREVLKWVLGTDRRLTGVMCSIRWSEVRPSIDFHSLQPLGAAKGESKWN